MIKVALIALSFLMTACFTKSKSKTSAFNNFKAKAKVVNLPLHLWKTDKTEGIVPYSFSLERKSEDTLFVKPSEFDNYEFVHCLGKLPDTSRFFTFVFQNGFFNNSPFLYTFTKEGKFISKVYFEQYGCGGGPWYHCSTNLIIQKDQSVLSLDTNHIPHIGKGGEPVDSLEINIVRKRSGQINSQGKIIMGKQIETNLNK